MVWCHVTSVRLGRAMGANNKNACEAYYGFCKMSFRCAAILLTGCYARGHFLPTVPRRPALNEAHPSSVHPILGIVVLHARLGLLMLRITFSRWLTCKLSCSPGSESRWPGLVHTRVYIPAAELNTRVLRPQLPPAAPGVDLCAAH